MSEVPERAGDSTEAVHAGRRGRKAAPLAEPVVRASAFTVDAMADFDPLYEGRKSGYVYARFGSPTVDAAARRLAVLEGAEACVLAASGMAAISTTLLAHARAGGRFLAQSEVYGATNNLLTQVVARLGVRVDRFSATDTKALERLLAEGPADLVYLESPTNPTVRLPDLRAAAALARHAGAVSVVDGTFATPVNSRPLALGVDLVVHSATKYLGGHGDVMAGAVLGAKAHVDRVHAHLKLLGGVLDADTAYLLDRGLKTLPLRMARVNANAQGLAETLERHPKVARVHYPGLASHPQHALAKAQMPGGFGGILAFDLKADTREAAERFSDALQLVKNAATLGTAETLVMVSVLNSHRGQTPETLAAAGIGPSTMRISCGLEDLSDLRADVLQALDKV